MGMPTIIAAGAVKRRHSKEFQARPLPDTAPVGEADFFGGLAVQAAAASLPTAPTCMEFRPSHVAKGEGHVASAPCTLYPVPCKTIKNMGISFLAKQAENRAPDSY